ncbi:hypothetical protein [Lysobacter tyrosinilyticus]
MNIRFALIAASLLAFSAPAFAGDDVAQLSKQTGLKERHVRMIIGCATCVPEYAYVYDRKLRQFKTALGEANYRRLMSGQPITLPNGERVSIRVAVK